MLYRKMNPNPPGGLWGVTLCVVLQVGGLDGCLLDKDGQPKSPEAWHQMRRVRKEGMFRGMLGVPPSVGQPSITPPSVPDYAEPPVCIAPMVDPIGGFSVPVSSVPRSV
jgi:hypothetical protein